MALPHFAADPPEASQSVELEGLTLLYHRPSGMTHILAPPAPQILDTLAPGPAGVEEIARRMSERFELEEEDAISAITARLAELEASGLVWRP